MEAGKRGAIGTGALTGALLVLAALRVSSVEAERRRAWQACARWIAGTVETRHGPLPERWRGLAEPVHSDGGIPSARLLFPERRVSGGWVPWPGPVRVLLAEGPRAGPVELDASPRCSPLSQNPTDLDFFASFRWPRLRLDADRVRIRPAESATEGAVAALLRWRERLGERLRPWPRAFGLLRAAWTGELGGLPSSWQTVFRDGGALAVVALSGQHVALIAGWVLAAMTFFGRVLPARGLGYARVREATPPMVALTLVLLGNGAPSTVRAAATTFAARLFQRRGLDVSALRVAMVSGAVTVIASPSFLASPGYLLSAGGAALLALGASSSRKKRWLWNLVGLPLALAPLVVYGFARLPLAGLVVAVLVGFAWEAIVLPASFFGLPVLDALPDAALVATLDRVERGLHAVENGLVTIGPWLAEAVVVLPVPTPLELVAFYGLVTVVVGAWATATTNARKLR